MKNLKIFFISLCSICIFSDAYSAQSRIIEQQQARVERNLEDLAQLQTVMTEVIVDRDTKRIEIVIPHQVLAGFIGVALVGSIIEGAFRKGISKKRTFIKLSSSLGVLAYAKVKLDEVEISLSILEHDIKEFKEMIELKREELEMELEILQELKNS